MVDGKEEGIQTRAAGGSEELGAGEWANKMIEDAASGNGSKSGVYLGRQV